jgi:SAM-dependent methyltransferase
MSVPDPAIIRSASPSASAREGEVFAIDTVAEHLAYLDRTMERLGVNNIRTIQTDGKSLGLTGEQVDAVFLCSLYHNVYAMSTAPARDAFVQAIKDALSDDGLLYLADNGLVPRGVLPYHGPYVAKELVIAQLLNYGFELVRQHQHIPQRYLLVFKKAAADSGTPLVSATRGSGRRRLRFGIEVGHATGS